MPSLGTGRIEPSHAEISGGVSWRLELRILSHVTYLPVYAASRPISLDGMGLNNPVTSVKVMDVKYFRKMWNNLSANYLEISTFFA
jgi:hypothetical protein